MAFDAVCISEHLYMFRANGEESEILIATKIFFDEIYRYDKKDRINREADQIKVTIIRGHSDSNERDSLLS